MYCMKCGAQLPEGTRFCLNCGAEQPAPADTANASAPVYNAGDYQPPRDNTASAPAPVKAKKSKKPFIISAAGLLLVAAIILTIVLVSGGSPESRAAAFMKCVGSATNTRLDANTVFDYLPPEYMEKMAQNMGMTVEGYKKSVQRLFDDQYRQIVNNPELAEKNKLISVDVLRVEELTPDELEDLHRQSDFSFSEAKRVIMKIVYMEDGEVETNENNQLVMVKVGSKWYVHPNQNFGF